MPLFLWFDLSLEAMAEISEIFSLVFLSKTMTPKGHFEINWPLTLIEKNPMGTSKCNEQVSKIEIGLRLNDL